MQLFCFQCSVFGMGEIKRHWPHCYCDDHATLLSHSRESFGSKLCAGPRRIRATWKVATKEAEEEEAALGAVHQNQYKYKTNTTQIQSKCKANTKYSIESWDKRKQRRTHSAPSKCWQYLKRGVQQNITQ